MSPKIFQLVKIINPPSNSLRRNVGGDERDFVKGGKEKVSF